VKISSAAISDKGPTRTRNEDAVLTDESMGLFLLADGLGGHKKGDMASATVTLSVHHRLKEMLQAEPDKPADVSLREAVKHVNASIYEEQAEEEHRSKMGSTLVAAWFKGPHLLVANVGDSRLYRLRKGKLKLLTRDHTLMEEIHKHRDPRSGKEREFLSSKLLKVMGMHPEVEPDLGLEQTKAGDRYLLCSDGLSNELAASEMRDVLAAAADAEEAAAGLVREALSREAKDNVSAVVVDVEDNSGEGFVLSKKLGPIRKSPVKRGLFVLFFLAAAALLAAAFYHRPRPAVTPASALDALLAGDYSTAADLYRRKARSERAGEGRISALLGLAVALWRLHRDDEAAETLDSVLAEAERSGADVSLSSWPLPPPKALQQLAGERAAAAWEGFKRRHWKGGSASFKARVILDEARELYVKHLKVGEAARLLESFSPNAGAP